MSIEEPDSTLLGVTVSDWLAEEALYSSDLATLYAELCVRLRAVGMPISRGQVLFRVLHPLYDASAIRWTADEGVLVTQFGPDEGRQAWFRRSSYGHALANRLPVLRRRLIGETALLDFENLEGLRVLGGTDYVVLLIGFDRAGATGVIASWMTDRTTGFTDTEIVQLRRITREFSVSMKSRIERNVALNVAHAYLGKRAGEAVLNGSIKRGDGEKVSAALWYSDLRQSTALADQLPAEEFLSLLNSYFEMTAGAVLVNGGEVVSLIGDAVLGLFRVDESRTAACGRALAAALEAQRRLCTTAKSGTSLKFGIALHLGEVIYGNVGVPERLQFTVVGAAVNEVVRVQDLTKVTHYPVLATAPFASAVGGEWCSVGEHILRGRETPMPIFARA